MLLSATTKLCLQALLKTPLALLIKTMQTDRYWTLTIDGSAFSGQIKPGDSIAVNGVCLTVTDIANNCFKADVSQETKQCTTLANLAVNTKVNFGARNDLSTRFKWSFG